MNIYARKRHWFKTRLAALAVLLLLLCSPFLPVDRAAAQTGVTITVTYTDPINVRGGPSTVDYPIVGQLPSGATAPAVGISPGREWIQITFPGTASGTGWVYASFVSISGGELPVAEPPPTSIPPVTNTIDPTLAAAFEIQPTETRLPTFTAPPPLEIPRFEERTTLGSSGALGYFIIGLGAIGSIGLIVSFLLRK